MAHTLDCWVYFHVIPTCPRERSGLFEDVSMKEYLEGSSYFTDERNACYGALQQYE